jgi:hypothetical protein
MSELKDILKRIRAVSADEELNKSTMVALVKDSDCFGKMYDENHVMCGRCDCLMELDGRRESLSVFCKQYYEPDGKEELKVENVKEVAVSPRKEVKIENLDSDSPINWLGLRKEVIEQANLKQKEEKEMSDEAIATKKRRSKEEIDLILELNKAGKSFEEIQVVVRDKFNVERPIKSLKDMLKLGDSSIVGTKKRRSKEEIEAIVSLNKAGKTFEEIQVLIRDQFKVERPIKSLKDMLKLGSE